MLLIEEYLEEKKIKIRAKKIAVHVRRIVKIFVTMIIAAIFILGIIEISYKQTYSVSLNGEIIGSRKNTEDKEKTIEIVKENIDKFSKKIILLEKNNDMIFVKSVS